jgi:hypothetical protein
LAKNAEGWIVDRVADLASNPYILDEAFTVSRSKYERDVQPQRDALSVTQKALAENKAKADAMLETIGASGVAPELLAMLNEKAGELRWERSGLLLEARKLESMMQPIEKGFDALPLHSMLSRFSTLAQAAEPLEMQRILRAAVHKMEWLPERECVVDFYSFPDRPRQTKSPLRVNLTAIPNISICG